MSLLEKRVLSTQTNGHRDFGGFLHVSHVDLLIIPLPLPLPTVGKKDIYIVGFSLFFFADRRQRVILLLQLETKTGIIAISSKVRRVSYQYPDLTDLV